MCVCVCECECECACVCVCVRQMARFNRSTVVGGTIDSISCNGVILHQLIHTSKTALAFTGEVHSCSITFMDLNLFLCQTDSEELKSFLLSCTIIDKTSIKERFNIKVLVKRVSKLTHRMALKCFI